MSGFLVGFGSSSGTGSQGATGQRGATGAQGVAGTTGSQGATGSQGVTGLQGPTGVGLIAYLQAGITGFTGSYIATGPVQWNNPQLVAGNISQPTTKATGSAWITANIAMVVEVSYQIVATGPLPTAISWLVSQRLNSTGASGYGGGTGIPQSVAYLQSQPSQISSQVLQCDNTYLLAMPSGSSIETYIQPLIPGTTGVQLSATGSQFNVRQIA